MEEILKLEEVAMHVRAAGYVQIGVPEEDAKKLGVVFRKREPEKVFSVDSETEGKPLLTFLPPKPGLKTCIANCEPIQARDI